MVVSAPTVAVDARPRQQAVAIPVVREVVPIELRIFGIVALALGLGRRLDVALVNIEQKLEMMGKVKIKLLPDTRDKMYTWVGD